MLYVKFAYMLYQSHLPYYLIQLSLSIIMSLVIYLNL